MPPTNIIADINSDGTITFPATGHVWTFTPEPISVNGASPDVLDREAQYVRSIALRHQAEAIPNSQSLKGQELGMSLLRVWETDEPAPRAYAVEGLVPTKSTTTMFAPGGFGKSLLAVYLATATATGSAFLGRQTRKSPVLYLDAELEDEEFRRRAYRVARGLNMTRPPNGLHYVRLRGSLMNPAVASEVLALKEAAQAGLVIVDSLMASTVGAEMVGDATDATSMYQFFDQLGTCVAIDHTPKPQAGSNHSDLTPYGTVFKQNWSRSVLQLIQADAGGLVLRQTKHNFGSLSQPIPFALTFEDDRVTLNVIDAGDDRLAGIENHLPAIERIARGLAQYKDGVTPAQLAEAVERSESSVRNYLTALKKQGRADSLDGLWSAIPNSYSPRDQELGTAECRQCRNRYESKHIDGAGLCFVCADPDGRGV